MPWPSRRPSPASGVARPARRARLRRRHRHCPRSSSVSAEEPREITENPSQDASPRGCRPRPRRVLRSAGVASAAVVPAGDADGMTHPSTTRALLAEALDDAAKLLRQVEALAPAPDRSGQALADAARSGLAGQLAAFEAQVTTLTERAKVQAVKHVLARTDEAGRGARSSCRRGRWPTRRRVALGAELGATLQRLQSACGGCGDGFRRHLDGGRHHVGALSAVDPRGGTHRTSGTGSKANRRTAAGVSGSRPRSDDARPGQSPSPHPRSRRVLRSRCLRRG